MSNMNIIGVKVFAGFLFFFLALFFGWMPSWCYTQFTRKMRASGRGGDDKKTFPIVQYLHAFASGVLVATCLLHLLPESMESVQDALTSRHTLDEPKVNSTKGNDSKIKKVVESDSGNENEYFPIAECLVAIGFLFVYIIDSMVKSVQKDCCTVKKCGNSWENSDEDVLLFEPDRYSDDKTITLALGKDRGSARVECGSSETSSITWSAQSRIPRRVPFLKPVESEEAVLSNTEHVQENGAFSDSDTLDQNDSAGLGKQPTNKSDSLSMLPSQPSEEIHTIRHMRERMTKTNQLRSVALVTALCIHGFFDGLMLGLQTSQSVALSLLLALALHKSFVALGLSLTLMGNNVSSAQTLCYVLAFALVAPLGLLLSAVFVHRTFDVSDESFGSLFTGCLQSFAVGTFMYVSFTETVERHEQKTGLCEEIMSHIFLIAGFTLMAALRAVMGSV